MFKQFSFPSAIFSRCRLFTGLPNRQDSVVTGCQEPLTLTVEVLLSEIWHWARKVIRKWEWGVHTRQFQLPVVSRVFLLSILFTPVFCFSSGLTVQSGAGITVSGGQIGLGCTDLVIDGDLSLGNGSISGAADVRLSGGNLDAGAGQISLAGDWVNNGVFTASTSRVNIVDGCSRTASTLSGDSDFYSFSAATANGKTLLITAASQQAFANSLGLQGASGVPLLIRSTVAGAQAFFNLDPAASQSISFIDVQDNNALSGSLIAPGSPASFNSVNSGNNLNWFTLPFANIPIPTLSIPAWLLLVITLLFVALRSLSQSVLSKR